MTSREEKKRKKRNDDDDDDVDDNTYIYVGDFKFNNNNNSSNKNKYQYYDLQKRIDILSKRLNYIEASLAPSNILKATPITSLVMGDTKCLRRIQNIYSKWINYMSHVAHNNDGLNIENVFSFIDNYIFDNYFEKLQQTYYIEFVNITYNINGFSSEQTRILKEALQKDRNYYFKLLYPEYNERISTLVEKKSKRIFLIYFHEEIKEIIKIETNNNNNNDNNNDFQLSCDKLHPIISLDKDIIGPSDRNSIKVFEESENNSLDISTFKDKRHDILGSRRTLYNTLIDLDSLNKFNSRLHNFNQSLLNLSLIVYHAMLHIKCDVSSLDVDNSTFRQHDSHFMKQYLNYTPSVLFGHPFIPPFTLPTT